MKAKFLLFICISLIAFSSCKKKITKTYEFSLVFSESTSESIYTIPEDIDDRAVLVYYGRSDQSWVLLPYYENDPGFVPVNYVATVNEAKNTILIETLRGDNEAGSPWAGQATLDFKAVLIRE